MEKRNHCNEEVLEENSETSAQGSGRFKSKRRKHGGLALEESFEYSFENNSKVGKCKLCGPEKKIIIRMKDSNTTGVKRHLRDYHPEIFAKTYTNEDVSSNLKKEVFQQEIFNTKLVDWIVMKYLLFSFFDDGPTQEIFHYLNPKANLPLRKELRSLIMKRYFEIEAIVFKILKSNSSKISFTLDGWTSISNRSYFGVTGHFIDENWQMHALTLFFIPSNGKHTGKEIAETFYNALHSFDLENKIQGVTLDNTAANTTFMTELAKCMEFDNVDQHFQCYAHILNLGVQDLLSELKLDKSACLENEDQCDGNIEDDDNEEDDGNEEEDENEKDDENCENVESTESLDSADDDLPVDENFPLVKLRNLFKILKRSEQWRIKLQNCCNMTEEKMQIPNIDVSTRWNSTYAMIQTAIKMQRSLVYLCSLNKELQKYLITDQEWLLLTRIFKILKCFKELTDVLTGEKYVTLSLVVIGFNLLLDMISKHINSLREKSVSQMNIVDFNILHGLETCFDKLMKHYKRSNWVYCAILILDPRHKVERFYQTSWGKEMATNSLKKFENMFKTIYYTPKEPSHNDKNVQNLTTSEDSDEEESLNLRGFFQKTTKAKKISIDSQEWRKEIDFYLSQPTVADVNILEWWKQNAKLYPKLSLMARDLFSIQATSVPAERLFSRGSLTIRKHRNKLNNESVKYLMCLNSWVTCSLAVKIQSLLDK